MRSKRPSIDINALGLAARIGGGDEDSALGRSKVLDYGLAKALEGEALGGTDAELSQSPTLTRHGTQVGVILGTAAYMSPEQAKGKQVDKRADIRAFGCLLFEMLSGERAFFGEGMTETLAKVIEREPALERLPDEVPPIIKRLVRRCLAKRQRDRLPDIAVARLDLARPCRESRRTSRRDPAASRSRHHCR